MSQVDSEAWMIRRACRGDKPNGIYRRLLTPDDCIEIHQEGTDHHLDKLEAILHSEDLSDEGRQFVINEIREIGGEVLEVDTREALGSA